MNVITLAVESSTETKNGNFANKLVSDDLTIETDFGTVTSRQTFYLFTKEENEKGKKAKLDLELFDIVPRTIWLVGEKDKQPVYNAEDLPEDMSHVDEVNLKYLYPKRQ